LRELSRNKRPSGRYSPLHAAGAYQLRRQEQKTEEAAEEEDYIRRFIEFVGLCQPHEIRIEELFWPAGTSRN
jgi:hypothetical protein